MSSSSPRALRQTSAEAVPARIRLLIADDTPMNCQLLQTAFNVYRNQFEVVACAVSEQNIIDCFKHIAIDVALMNADLADGRLAGLRVLRELRISYPRTPVVMLFDCLQDDLILDAFRAGAKGLLGRGEPLELLGKCIQAVHEGQVWANSLQLHLLLRALINAAPIWPADGKGLSLLGRREAQVVQLLVDGLPNREIAVRLGITEHTVSNYLFRIYNKLGVSSRVELVLYVVKQSEEAGQVFGGKVPGPPLEVERWFSDQIRLESGRESS